MKRIMIVGPSGVGKSSLLNLLADKELTTVGDSAEGVTLQCKEFCIPHKGVTYRIADTVGLTERDKGKVCHTEALKRLIRFIKKHETGFNLIVFVMKKGRIDRSFEQTYSLFYEAVFKKEIPIVLYVSECEQENQMDRWQIDNATSINKYAFNRVICGTAISTGPEMRFPDIFIHLREETKINMWKAMQDLSLPMPVPIRLAHLPFWKHLINIISNFFGSASIYATETKQQLLIHLKNLDFDEQDIKVIADMIE